MNKKLGEYFYICDVNMTDVGDCIGLFQLFDTFLQDG